MNPNSINNRITEIGTPSNHNKPGIELTPLENHDLIGGEGRGECDKDQQDGGPLRTAVTPLCCLSLLWVNHVCLRCECLKAQLAGAKTVPAHPDLKEWDGRLAAFP